MSNSSGTSQAQVTQALNKGPKTPQERLTDQDVHDRVADRGLRRFYATFILLILLVQLTLVNALFVGYGITVFLDRLDFDPWALRLFIGATITQVFGVFFVVTRYLFSKS